MWQPCAKVSRYRKEGLHLISQALNREETDDGEGCNKEVKELTTALYKMGVHELDLAIRLLDQIKDEDEEKRGQFIIDRLNLSMV